MPNPIPEDISFEDIVLAIAALERGELINFGPSTGYDVLYNGKRYAPKAVIGLASLHRAGLKLGPKDFKGGLGSKCFRILEENGFLIVPKVSSNLLPDEIEPSYREGAGKSIFVNRFERDIKARDACICHFSAKCQICGLDFQDMYGDIGKGFIHVHHLIPLASVGIEYVVNPVTDLVPVCPNCHAMLHTRTPPLSIDELKQSIFINAGPRKR